MLPKFRVHEPYIWIHSLLHTVINLAAYPRKFGLSSQVCDAAHLCSRLTWFERSRPPLDSIKEVD